MRLSPLTSFCLTGILFRGNRKGGGMAASANVAVFIDWENLYISIQKEYGEKRPDASFLVEVILNEAKHLGIPIARAYANWDSFPGVMNTIKGKGVEPQRPYAKREEHTIPDAADIALCLDAVETCFESTHIRTRSFQSRRAGLLRTMRKSRKSYRSP